MTTEAAASARTPGLTAKLVNGLVGRLARYGISLWGTRELSVRGRSTGERRRTPINVLRHGGHSYLVAPRGEVQWVRNLRAAGGGELRLGRSVVPFTATELADQDKPAVLRDYIRRWKFEVGAFFGDVHEDSDEDDLRAVAHRYPVFRLST